MYSSLNDLLFHGGFGVDFERDADEASFSDRSSILVGDAQRKTQFQRHLNEKKTDEHAQLNHLAKPWTSPTGL